MPDTSQSRRTRKPLPRRKIALLLAVVAALRVPPLLTAVGLFLSSWIVVPAPTLWLLQFGVAAPEISPWLIGLNAIAVGLSLHGLHKGWLSWVLLGCSMFSLLLSSVPLIQFPAANQRSAVAMQQALGPDYLSKIPLPVQAHFRPHPFSLLDSLRGIPTAEVRTERGIQFAAPTGVPLKLNVYRPLTTGLHPAIVVLYGGAWKSGSPDHDELFSRYMAAQGYTVVAIDYRHAPQYRFPAQLEDVRTAIAYIHTHATELEVDPARMALMGRSAGAHLAMLAAYQADAPPIRAVVDYYGPVDLVSGYRDLPHPDPIDSRTVLRSFLGGPPDQLLKLYQQASPIYSIRPALPPSLLIYGEHDHLVQAKFGRALYERLQATGNQAIFLTIPWAEHAFDAVFNGPSNQLALYYTERFLAWALRS